MTLLLGTQESSLGYAGNNTELESLIRADNKTTVDIVLRLRDPYLIRAGLCEYIMIKTQPIWAKCWRPKKREKRGGEGCGSGADRTKSRMPSRQFAPY